MTTFPAPKTGSIRVFIHPDMMDLLPAYLKRRDSDVELLRNYIGNQDFKAIQLLGHKLSGNGSVFGFDPISKTGKDLESAAINKDMSKVQEHTQELFAYLSNIEICPKEKNENA